MSNEFENKNDGEETNQNPYYQDYGDPSQGSGQQDYSNPYQSGQQDYSNPYQSGQQDYSNPYQNGQYNSYTAGMNTPYQNGNVPLDKKGQPLKNRFGMKLTFSILEMVLGINIITLVCGIVACVFTCKANSSYKEGKWEEFKSHGKVANIFLWIGFGVCAVVYVGLIILLAVFGLSALPFLTSETIVSSVGSSHPDYYDEEDFNYYDEDEDEETDDDADDWDYEDDYYDDDDYYNDDDYDDADDEETSPAPEVTAGNGYTDPTVTINGVTVSFPLSYDEFTAQTGLSIDEDDMSEIVSADDYDNYDITSAYDSEGNDVCSIWLYNMSGSDLAMEDCYVAGIIVYNDEYSVTPDLMIQNGITFASTQEQIKTALGVPSDTYSSKYDDGSVYESWNWNYEDPDADYFDEIEIEFMDGQITKIEVDNATLP